MQVSSKQWVNLLVESVIVSLPTRDMAAITCAHTQTLLVMSAIVADMS